MIAEQEKVMAENWSTDLEWVNLNRGHDVLYVKTDEPSSGIAAGIVAQVWKLGTREETETRAKLIAIGPDLIALARMVADYQIELAQSGQSLPSRIVDAVNEAFSRFNFNA